MASIAVIPAFPTPKPILTGRERVALVVGATAVLIFLIWILRGGDDSEAAGKIAGTGQQELAAAMIDSRMESSPAATVVQPLPTVPAAGDAAGLRLDGIMARIAILSFSDGTQRWVPLGREFLPGFTLKTLAVDHVIIANGDQDLRLELNGFGGLVPAQPTPASIGPGPANDRQGKPDRRAGEAQLGFQPAKVNDRTSGYRITTRVRMPELRRAGMVAGDVILSVNGAKLDEERLMELSWTLANSERTEFSYSRNGRTINTAFSK